MRSIGRSVRSVRSVCKKYSCYSDYSCSKKIRVRSACQIDSCYYFPLVSGPSANLVLFVFKKQYSSCSKILLSVFKNNYSCSIIQKSIIQNARSAQFKIQKSKFKSLFTTLAGLPTASESSGMSLTTTLPAPITHLLPIFTPGHTTTPAPSQQSQPMDMGKQVSTGFRRSR